MNTTTTAAMSLAHHVLKHLGAVDHLKLQKLCFYSYGAALAAGVDSHLGEVTFEPWKHGPVCREVWDRFKVYKAEIIPTPEGASEFAAAPLRDAVNDALAVYGRMTSWAIRCESHLEEPWVRARHDGRPLTNDELREHFSRKFAAGNVTLPAYLAGAASSALDNIPAARFVSLHELAAVLNRSVDELP